MATAVGLIYVKAFYSLQKQQQSRFSFPMPAPKRVAVTKGDFCLYLYGSKTFQSTSTWETRKNVVGLAYYSKLIAALPQNHSTKANEVVKVGTYSRETLDFSLIVAAIAAIAAKWHRHYVGCRKREVPFIMIRT